MNVKNSTNNENELSQVSTANCLVLKMIAVYMLVLLLLSTIFNSYNLLIFYKTKNFKPISCLMTTLVSINLVASFLEAPPMIHNGFNCM